jgi:predicted glutamine amidotransferase
MCRVLAYLGEPIGLGDVLYETDSSLVSQSHSPRMTQGYLNLGGFGMAAWDPRSLQPDEPFVYRATTLPAYDRNLRGLADKLAPTCLLAHVRGVPLSSHEVVAAPNLHPFRFQGARVTFAHNGHLRQFADMRFDLVEHVLPELRSRIEGTTDSEWIYALVLSQLRDPYGLPELRDLADATVAALRILRDVRTRLGMETSSPVNVFLTAGEQLVVTRFSFDYGWYPDDDIHLEADLPYVSLWCTVGGEFTRGEDGFGMADSDPPKSLLIASEPLTVDLSGWLEVPEYAMITATRTPEGLDFQTRDLDA